MSKYTNYTQVSQTYDTVRYASGVDVMTNVLAGILQKSPAEIKMLEAGCGTGNYSRGFLQQGIGQLTMLDANEGMLARATEKVKEFDGGKVEEIRQHALPSLPYPDESFDCVAFVQVLHHLDTYHLQAKNDDSLKQEGLNGHAAMQQNGEKEEEEEDFTIKASFSIKEKYPNLIKAIKESFRVLKPNGVLMVDHAFDANIDGLWITLAPKASELFKKAFICGSDLIDVLKTENYDDIFCITRPGASCSRTGAFENPELVLDVNWRKNLSEWSFLDRTGEIDGVIEFIQKKKEDGTLTAFAYEKNKSFRLYGETTTVFARKR